MTDRDDTDTREPSEDDCSCQQVGVLEDAACPRHGIVAFITRLADAREDDRD